MPESETDRLERRACRGTASKPESGSSPEVMGSAGAIKFDKAFAQLEVVIVGHSNSSLRKVNMAAKGTPNGLSEDDRARGRVEDDTSGLALSSSSSSGKCVNRGLHTYGEPDGVRKQKEDRISSSTRGLERMQCGFGVSISITLEALVVAKLYLQLEDEGLRLRRDSEVKVAPVQTLSSGVALTGPNIANTASEGGEEDDAEAVGYFSVPSAGSTDESVEQKGAARLEHTRSSRVGRRARGQGSSRRQRAIRTIARRPDDCTQTGRLHADRTIARRPVLA